MHYAVYVKMTDNSKGLHIYALSAPTSRHSTKYIKVICKDFKQNYMH